MRQDDRITILEERKWIWSREEIERATALFSYGLVPSQVAEEMGEYPVDIGMLYLHLLDAGKIEVRE